MRKEENTIKAWIDDTVVHNSKIRQKSKSSSMNELTEMMQYGNHIKKES